MTSTKKASDLGLGDVWIRKGKEPCRLLAMWFTSPARDEIAVRYQDPFTAPETFKTDLLAAVADVEVEA